MPDRPDKTGPNQRFARYQSTGGNNNMKPQKFSLLGAFAAALLLLAAFVPRANATLIVYFNFEDEAPGDPFTAGTFDGVADTIAADGFGGTQNSNLMMHGYDLAGFGSGPALVIASTNRAAGDTDQTNNSALVMNRTSKNNGAYLEFNVDTSLLKDLSLSFAVDNNGNGFNSITLKYATSPVGTFNTVTTFALTTGANQLISSGTFNVTPSVDGVFRLVFTGGQSNGNNRETAIDNIQLNGTVVPEPATVAGGLLGVCGLCWLQRRRLIRSVRLRRA
jgi:hypothetical protein